MNFIRKQMEKQKGKSWELQLEKGLKHGSGLPLIVSVNILWPVFMVTS